MFQQFQRVAVALFVAALAFYPLSSWAGGAAGKITHVQGQVEVRRLGDVGARSARRWMDVFPDDVIETGANGRARILLSDSSVLTLSEQSKLRIDEQVYDPAKGERKSLLNLFRGKVRAVVSKYLNASKSRFEIHTPTAVAGVRGTT
ncbi:MAG: FecR family protein, partial [Bdellovibrionota bacterium]